MKPTASKSANRTGIRQPANRAFERELAELEAMSGRELTPEDVERLRRMLGHANNFLVSKAARRVAEAELMPLLPEVQTAYLRFFSDAVKSDPQCWAKTELAKALVKLECHDAELYIKGLRHKQEEPVWGGQSDTAGRLRATCTHALVSCPGLSNAQLLDLLLEPLVDSDKTVRIEAARAIGHTGGMAAALLLKLRVLVGKDEPEVMGACFSALLHMDTEERGSAIPLVAEFLEEEDELAGEAAFALAETHHIAAFATLTARRKRGASSWLYAVLDHAIALTRLPEALEYLLRLLEDEPRHAETVLEAISRVYASAEVQERVESAVTRADSSRAWQAYRQFFPGEVS